MASGILLHDRLAGPDLSIRSALTAAGLHFCRRLVKDSRVVETRTPSLDECALPCSSWPRSPLARPPETGITRSSRTRHRTHDLAAAGRLRMSSSPFESPQSKPRVDRSAISPSYASELGSCVRDPTSPVDFCNQNSPRAQPRTLRVPVEIADVTCPARAELGGDLLAGLGPRPPRR